MKSEKSEFDLEFIELVDAMFDDYDNNLVKIVCVEHNNEVIVGFVSSDENFDGRYTISLPIHLIEFTGYDDNDALYSSYKFLPYRQISERFGDLTFSKSPDVIFTPNQDVFESYIRYWFKITYDLSMELDSEYDIMSVTKS